MLRERGIGTGGGQAGEASRRQPAEIVSAWGFPASHLSPGPEGRASGEQGPGQQGFGWRCHPGASVMVPWGEWKETSSLVFNVEQMMGPRDPEGRGASHLEEPTEADRGGRLRDFHRETFSTSSPSSRLRQVAAARAKVNKTLTQYIHPGGQQLLVRCPQSVAVPLLTQFTDEQTEALRLHSSGLVC